MAVVTISRELGSEGAYIGRKTAEVLGYHFVDKFVIEDLLREYGMVQFIDVYESTPGFWTRFDKMSFELIEMLNKVILALALKGNMVIMGRGGFAVLGGYGDALNVRIQAPFSSRVRRVMEKEKISELQKAEDLVKENDRSRSAFIQTFYNTRWDMADSFNLVIDTGSVSTESAVHWIEEATRALEKRIFEENELSTRLIPMDPTLLKVITEHRLFNEPGE